MEELVKKHRRYPMGKYPQYDNALALKLSKSPQNNQDALNHSGIDINSIFSLQYLKTVYEEKEKVLLEKDKWRKIEETSAKQIAINQGKRYRNTVSVEELELAAELNFLAIQQDWIGQRIAELEQEEKAAEDKERLRKIYSVPLGQVESINYETGRGHISYMKVAPLNGDGIVCVLDEMSPYNGMSVLDFREFVLPMYRLEMNKIYEQRMKEWKDNGKEGLAPSLRKIKPKWPKWPEGVKNHLQGETIKA